MHFRVSHQSQCGLYQIVWVESNCLSENKMVSTLNWRHVSFMGVARGGPGVPVTPPL